MGASELAAPTSPPTHRRHTTVISLGSNFGGIVCGEHEQHDDTSVKAQAKAVRSGMTREGAVNWTTVQKHNNDDQVMISGWIPALVFTRQAMRQFKDRGGSKQVILCFATTRNERPNMYTCPERGSHGSNRSPLRTNAGCKRSNSARVYDYVPYFYQIFMQVLTHAHFLC